jgi:hypothetical protein
LFNKESKYPAPPPPPPPPLLLLLLLLLLVVVVVVVVVVWYELHEPKEKKVSDYIRIFVSEGGCRQCVEEGLHTKWTQHVARPRHKE